ncbi:MAG: DinB family protein [Bacteroidetes bacterium]|nr:DinB family protein [Bacteroidota bacterium]
MLLKTPIEEVFIQLTDALDKLTDEQYTQPSKILFNATMGQHVRHIIELFLCLQNGYEEGTVNYEKRKRDYRIETDRDFARFLLRSIFRKMGRPNKLINLEAEDYIENIETVTIPSNYYREIAYNLEHTIHHMALIRVGINEVSSLKLPENFGVAFSTINYRLQCAQ